MFSLVASFLSSGIGYYCSSFQCLHAMVLPLALVFLLLIDFLLCLVMALATMEKSEWLRLWVAIYIISRYNLGSKWDLISYYFHLMLLSLANSRVGMCLKLILPCYYILQDDVDMHRPAVLLSILPAVPSPVRAPRCLWQVPGKERDPYLYSTAALGKVSLVSQSCTQSSRRLAPHHLLHQQRASSSPPGSIQHIRCNNAMVAHMVGLRTLMRPASRKAVHVDAVRPCDVRCLTMRCALPRWPRLPPRCRARASRTGGTSLAPRAAHGTRPSAIRSLLPRCGRRHTDKSVAAADDAERGTRLRPLNGN
jgi:hypothetical protein